MFANEFATKFYPNGKWNCVEADLGGKGCYVTFHRKTSLLSNNPSSLRRDVSSVQRRTENQVQRGIK